MQTNFSPEIQDILQSKCGYRDDSIFGDGIRNPYEVCFYETQNLGNVDIVECILQNYTNNLDKEEIDYLNEIIKYNNGEDVFSEIDKDYFCDIIKKVIGDRDTCLWVCNNPCYVEKNYKGTNISKYDFPNDFMVLSDLATWGALIVYTER